MAAMIWRLGSQGADVGRIHQELLEQGLVVDAGELAGEQYGLSTVVAIKALQVQRGLRVDGICGPQTIAALERASHATTAPGWRCRPSEIREAVRPAVQAAVDDLGTCEDPPGSNSGPGLLKYRGHAPGQAWCAYWVSWALSHAVGGCPFGIRGSAVGILAWAQRMGRDLGEAALPQPGDLWVRMRTEEEGHVCLIVDTTGGGGVLSCIGGNQGDRVSGDLRRRADATAIVRAVPL